MGVILENFFLTNFRFQMNSVPCVSQEKISESEVRSYLHKETNLIICGYSIEVRTVHTVV